MYGAFADAKNARRLPYGRFAFNYVIADFQHTLRDIFLHENSLPKPKLC